MSTNINMSHLNEFDDSSMDSFYSAKSDDDDLYVEEQCVESAEHIVHDCNSDGFALSVGINIPDNTALDIDDCEMQSEDNPKMSAWKDKSGCVKCTANADKDEAHKILKNEVLCTKDSVKKVFSDH